MDQRKVQVYLMNAKSILDYGAPPCFSIDLSEEVDNYWTRSQGYIHCGEFVATFPAIPTREELVVKSVEALRAKIEETRVTAETVCQQLEQQIGDLLMLGHEAPNVRV